MKRNPEFLLRQVADSQVLVPVGRAAVEFPGMITLNGVGSYLWELLEQEQTAESLDQALTERYEVTYDTALEDVNAYLSRLQEAKALL